MKQSAVRNGPTRWDLTSATLKGFFGSPDAAGLKLALRFFPDDNPAAGCNDEACDAVACSQPLVALGSLSGNKQTKPPPRRQNERPLA